ncbi:MAG: Ig-like domain-containing protein [Terriglobales bacterium]
MFKGRKLPLTLVFAGMLLVAFGAGCRGFFVPPTLTSIAINPTAPEVGIGDTTSLQVYGTYNDGSRSIVTTGVGWSSSTPSVATVVGTGGATLTGVSSGTTTITASAQALSATASATVFGNVSSITVSPTNQTVTIGDTGVYFTFAATPGPPYFITTGNGGTLAITNAANDGLVTCTSSTNSSNDPAELCIANSGAVGPYSLVMTYPSSAGGTVTSNTATLNVAQ